MNQATRRNQSSPRIARYTYSAAVLLVICRVSRIAAALLDAEIRGAPMGLKLMLS
jgi:hypothetical protein